MHFAIFKQQQTHKQYKQMETNLKFLESTNQLLTAAVKPSPPFPHDETCLYPQTHEFSAELLQRLVVPMHPPATKPDNRVTREATLFSTRSHFFWILGIT